jgi:hypothetical protein
MVREMTRRLNNNSVPPVLNFITKKVRGFASKAAFFCALALTVAIVHAREISGISFPEVVSVAGRELRLNGMGVLKKAIFVKVYVVGLYLEKRTTDARAAISIDEARRIVIGMRRNVSRHAFVQAVETAIMLNSGAAMPTLRARLDLLEHALPALKKGDVLDFTYLPGSGTRMRCQGQELTIPGKDFADALFSVWLGPKPVDAALKRELLGVSQ